MILRYTESDLILRLEAPLSGAIRDVGRALGLAPEGHDVEPDGLAEPANPAAEQVPPTREILTGTPVIRRRDLAPRQEQHLDRPPVPSSPPEEIVSRPSAPLRRPEGSEGSGAGAAPGPWVHPSPSGLSTPDPTPGVRGGNSRPYTPPGHLPPLTGGEGGARPSAAASPRLNTAPPSGAVPSPAPAAASHPSSLPVSLRTPATLTGGWPSPRRADAPLLAEMGLSRSALPDPERAAGGGTRDAAVPGHFAGEGAGEIASDRPTSAGEPGRGPPGAPGLLPTRALTPQAPAAPSAARAGGWPSSVRAEASAPAKMDVPSGAAGPGRDAGAGPVNLLSPTRPHPAPVSGRAPGRAPSPPTQSSAPATPGVRLRPSPGHTSTPEIFLSVDASPTLLPIPIQRTASNTGYNSISQEASPPVSAPDLDPVALETALVAVLRAAARRHGVDL